VPEPAQDASLERKAHQRLRMENASSTKPGTRKAGAMYRKVSPPPPIPIAANATPAHSSGVAAIIKGLGLIFFCTRHSNGSPELAADREMHNYDASITREFGIYCHDAEVAP